MRLNADRNLYDEGDQFWVVLLLFRTESMPNDIKCGDKKCLMYSKSSDINARSVIILS